MIVLAVIILTLAIMLAAIGGFDVYSISALIVLTVALAAFIRAMMGGADEVNNG